MTRKSSQADSPPIHFLGLAPRFLGGVLEIPVYHMRGGTSTGIVLYEGHLPKDRALREELIRRIMGVPLDGEVSGNRQITGLGRGIPQSCKVFIVDRSGRDDADIDSTLAQLAPDKAAIDWSVNCGNMSAALPVFAGEVGLLSLDPGTNRVRIHNTNTGVVAHALLDMPEPGAPMEAHTEIPGVMGEWPGVQLALLEPVGAKTGALLPTGNAVDTVDGLKVSCVDLAVPMVVIRAEDMGKTAAEAPDALDADADFRARLQRIWVEAGRKMGLKNADGTPMTEAQLVASETIPKACIVAAPSAEEAAKGANIRVRYFTPQAAHKSLAVTGGACLAACCLIPGTVGNALAQDLAPLGPDEADHVVRMANPAGLLKATITGLVRDGEISMPSAAYERSTQILLRGHTPIYNASPALLDAYREIAKAA
ncbi:MAG: PrpF protein [Alphaproteobacteria bacterium]|nr:PrpF protein [Alphaproteobacteria bacterium]